MSETFAAYVVRSEGGAFSSGFERLEHSALPVGNVQIEVAYSSVNYKDGLAALPKGRVVRSYPMVPGIDIVGTVTSSTDARFHPGDEVIATSYDIGTSHFGGYSEVAALPADWVVPLPAGLSLRQAAILGTAGFTAALCLDALERQGLVHDGGPVLVTGASGGVGTLATALLSRAGYQVAASTGKAAAHSLLTDLGAREILSREETMAAASPLSSQRWSGAIDCVGQGTLPYILSTLNYGAAVAACGLTGGSDLTTTVFPFILRGCSLLGIDSAYCPMQRRVPIWQRLASDWHLGAALERIAHEIPFPDLPGALSAIVRGELSGRTIVRIR